AAGAWRSAGSRCGGCSERSATSTTTGRPPTVRSRSSWPSCGGTGGTPTSRRAAGASSSRSRTRSRASPGRSTPATPPDHHHHHHHRRRAGRVVAGGGVVGAGPERVGSVVLEGGDELGEDLVDVADDAQ